MRGQRDGRVTFAGPEARPGLRRQLTDARASTLVVVLSLYVLFHRPVRLLSRRGLGLLRLIYLLLHLPLPFLRRIFLRFLPARGQVADQDERDHQYEEGSEPSPHTSPSLRWVVFRGFSLRVREVIRIHHSSLLATVDDQQPVLQVCCVDLGFFVGYAVVLKDLLAWGFWARTGFCPVP
jgi:hypothetical protein